MLRYDQMNGGSERENLIGRSKKNETQNNTNKIK